MEYFAKIVNSSKPLTIFAKLSILDIQQGSILDISQVIRFR